MSKNTDWTLSDRISKLPKWAQLHIQSLKYEIDRREGLARAHALLCEEKRDWFTIPNKVNGTMRLWLLDRDCPFSVCSLYEGDVLLIGRRKK